jgi:hypothetical protein
MHLDAVGNKKGVTYVVAAAAAAELDGPAFAPAVDMRRDGSAAFFRTVFILDKTFPKPFLSFSFGTDGPPWAGELMMAVLCLCCCDMTA